MSPHLDGEALEAAARGQAVPHLAECAECRARVADARGRQRLFAGLRPFTLSEAAFRRVEAHLDEAVEHGPSGLPWRWWALAGLAAVAAVVMLLWPLEPSRVGRATPVPVTQRGPVSIEPVTVVAAASDARARHADEAWRTLAAGDVLVAGEALSASSLTLALDSAVRWALHLSGSAALGGAAAVTLGAGELVAEVEAAFDALAGPRRFLATEATFAVTRAGAEVVLDVWRGSVDVVDESGAVRRVRAPARLRWSDEARLADGVSESPRARVELALPERPWAVLDASALPAGTRVTLDGASLGVAPFAALVTAGRRQLELAPPGKAVSVAWVELVGGQPFRARPEALKADAEAPGPSEEAVAALSRALLQHKPKLAACYEKWLKASPGARGEVTLELTVTAKGRVRAASVTGDTISPASAECLVSTAKSLALPAPGAEVTLEVPLRLQPPGR